MPTSASIAATVSASLRLVQDTNTASSRAPRAKPQSPHDRVRRDARRLAVVALVERRECRDLRAVRIEIRAHPGIHLRRIGRQHADPPAPSALKAAKAAVTGVVQATSGRARRIAGRPPPRPAPCSPRCSRTPPRPGASGRISSAAGAMRSPHRAQRLGCMSASLNSRAPRPQRRQYQWRNRAPWSGRSPAPAARSPRAPQCPHQACRQNAEIDEAGGPHHSPFLVKPARPELPAPAADQVGGDARRAVRHRPADMAVAGIEPQIAMPPASQHRQVVGRHRPQPGPHLGAMIVAPSGYSSCATDFMNAKSAGRWLAS